MMHPKPVVYLLVILPTLVLGGLAFVTALILAYTQVRGVPRNAIPNLNGMLIGLPALVLWVPMSLLFSNLVLVLVPQLRQIADEYVSKNVRHGFVESQMALLKVSGVVALICLPLIVSGFVL
ncbi:MAG: hypothetical protein K8U57_08640 [Planctomycetes bacterium]|nr:hypothetical protein [Planctomycetota bacterium]